MRLLLSDCAHLQGFYGSWRTAALRQRYYDSRHGPGGRRCLEPGDGHLGPRAGDDLQLPDSRMRRLQSSATAVVDFVPSWTSPREAAS